ncbi:MAG TPA: cytochrome c3 family protein, partial [Longimicrobiales bacterium]
MRFRTMTRATRGGWVVAVLLLLALRALPAQAQQSRSAQAACSECHNNVEPTRNRVLLHADSLTCLTCHHIGLSNDPRQIEARRAEVCRGCHNTLQPTHTAVPGRTVECSQCHNVHADRPFREEA